MLRGWGGEVTFTLLGSTPCVAPVFSGCGALRGCGDGYSHLCLSLPSGPPPTLCHFYPPSLAGEHLESWVWAGVYLIRQLKLCRGWAAGSRIHLLICLGNTGQGFVPVPSWQLHPLNTKFQMPGLRQRGSPWRPHSLQPLPALVISVEQPLRGGAGDANREQTGRCRSLLGPGVLAVTVWGGAANPHRQHDRRCTRRRRSGFHEHAPQREQSK